MRQIIFASQCNIVYFNTLYINELTYLI